MVRGVKKEKGKREKEKRNLIFLLFFLPITFYLLPFSHAADEPASDDDYWLSADPAAEESTDVTSSQSQKVPQKVPGSSEHARNLVPSDSEPETKSLVLKLMVVNPSTKHKQTYPLKAYLPEEVEVPHILEKDDLEVGYDSEKKAYYLSKEVELEPGASVVKAVRVLDVWFIREEKLDELSNEAHDVFERLQDTDYGDQGRLLMNNIEVLLMQILERQEEKNLTPNEHISVYRDNKKKVYDIEMDLMAMRRFLAAAGEGTSASKGKSGSMPGFFSKVAASSKNGMVPAGVLWRIIFIILIFLGVVSLLFVLIFQHQIRLSFSRKKVMEAIRHMAAKDKEKDKEKEKEKKLDLRITDFYPGLGEGPKPLKSDDHAA